MPIQKKYDKDFFKIWSDDMAYILGFLYADGNIVETKRGTHFIAAYTSDHSLLEQIKKVTQSEHKISQRTSDTGVVYRIQIGSKEWFHDVLKLGLHPHKSKRMNFPNVPEEYFGSFVRGYFDGDGNVWVGKLHKHRKTQTTCMYVAFTSASDEFLRALYSSLHFHGNVSGGSIYRSKVKAFSRLSFSTLDALKIYKIMYTVPHKLYLKRKKDVFEQFIRLRVRS